MKYFLGSKVYVLKLSILLVILILFFNFQSIFQSSASAEENKFFLDKVVAVVNKEVITWSELYKYMEFVANDEIKSLNPDERFKYFKKHQEELLEKLIDTKLQIEEAEKFGIFVSDSEIDAAINDIKKKYKMSDKAFNETLQKEGMTFEDYKKLLKEQVIIGRASNMFVKSKIIVTDEEINNYIAANPELSCDDDGYYVSQIFLKKRENEEELKIKINEILKRLIQGESFNRIASQFSEDVSARSGGSIGVLKKNEIAPQLAILLSQMNIGQVSEPIMTEHGIFIFRLDGICFKKGSERLINYVRNLLENEKFWNEYKLWIRSLRQKAYVEIMD